MAGSHACPRNVPGYERVGRDCSAVCEGLGLSEDRPKAEAGLD